MLRNGCSGRLKTSHEFDLVRRASEQPERVLIAEVDGHVVGFAAIGPSGDEDGGGDGEVRAMYLIAGHWGQGIGRALMGSALDALRQAGFTEATLWASPPTSGRDGSTRRVDGLQMAPSSRMTVAAFPLPSCATAAGLLDAIPLSELFHSIDNVTGAPRGGEPNHKAARLRSRGPLQAGAGPQPVWDECPHPASGPMAYLLDPV